MRRSTGTFTSLTNRNYRIYFAGHAVSVVGTWMQRVGQAWLVLELTDSGALLGLAVALQHLPTLVIGPWGGLMADRHDKRRILISMSLLAGLLALILGILTATGAVRYWMVLILALALGIVDSFARPARQTFVIEMVGPQHLTNAIMLNSIVVNAGMSAGPALGGVLIANLGLAPSFLINAASYGGVVVGLLMLRTAELRPVVPAGRARGQLRQGLGYVMSRRDLLVPLLLMSVAGMFAFEWTVTLPLLARDAFDGDAQTFGLLFSALGVGAVLGGLVVAGSLRATTGSLVMGGWVFSGLVVVAAAAPSLPIALAALMLLGGAAIAFKSTAQSLLQLLSAAEMRGRVTALLAVAVVGMRPIGAPIIGWVGDSFGGRVAMGMGGLMTALAATLAWFALTRIARSVPAVDPTDDTGLGTASQDAYDRGGA